MLSDMGVSAADKGRGSVMSYYGNVLGQPYKTDVRSSDITNAPAWSFQTENPPVSVREATQLAAKSLTETLGSLKNWNRQDITLMEWPEGYWIYRIDFQGPLYSLQTNLPSMKSESSLTVFVLMNGKVICPKPIQNKLTP